MLATGSLAHLTSKYSPSNNHTETLAGFLPLPDPVRLPMNESTPPTTFTTITPLLTN